MFTSVYLIILSIFASNRENTLSKTYEKRKKRYAYLVS